jgi:hypothetical protein
MDPMTQRQQEAFEALCRFMEAHSGAPPTMQELADILRISRPSAYILLQALLKRGHVHRPVSGARSYYPVKRRRCDGCRWDGSDTGIGSHSPCMTCARLASDNWENPLDA